jgi:hypothetical protein
MKMTDAEIKSLDMSGQSVVTVTKEQSEFVMANPTAAHLNVHIVLPDGNHCFTSSKDVKVVLDSMASAYEMTPEDWDGTLHVEVGNRGVTEYKLKGK